MSAVPRRSDGSHAGTMIGIGGVGGPEAYELIRRLLAIVLLVAALLKGHQLATGPIAGDSLFASRGFLIGLVEAELLFGLWLLVGLHPQLTWRATFGCFLAFSGIALAKMLSGEPSCGCFGRVFVPPWLTLALDAAAVAALLRWRPGGRRGPSVLSHPRRAAVFLVTALLVGVPMAAVMSRFRPATITAWGNLLGAGDLVVLEPESWVGGRFPLLEHIDIGNELARGYWIVVLYHHDCQACREAIPGYERRARAIASQWDAPRIALIEMPPYAPAGDGIVAVNSPCVSGRLNDARDWFITTPAEIRMRDSIVTTTGGTTRN